MTCTFTDACEKGAIASTRLMAWATTHTPEITFTIIGRELPAVGVELTTNASGENCADGLLLSSFVGDYTVTETVPSDYVADGDTSKTVAVSTEFTCWDGNEATVSFNNTPLTDITVPVNSQVDSGTASMIECVDAEGDIVTSGSIGTNSDGSVTVNDLPPGTYTCTIVIVH